MGKKVSMQMIADELNVTKVTVSKALNNKEGVSYDVRKKVLETAAEMGYMLKSNNDGGKGYNFAFLILAKFFEKRDEKFYTRIYSNLSNLCAQNSNSITLILVKQKDYDSNTIPKTLMNSFDGIFIGGEFCDKYLFEVEKLCNNLVAIDFSPEHLPFDCVVSDNFYLGYCATNYLIRKGHRNIAFLGLPTKTNSVCDRFYGYRKALFINKIEFCDGNLINNENMLADTYFVDLALPDVLPTAIVCNCDSAAYYLAQVLENKGIKVGKDVSLISFDNTDISEMMTPRLTTFNIDRKQFSFLSYDLMIDKIDKKRKETIRQYSKFELVERDSVMSLL